MLFELQMIRPIRFTKKKHYPMISIETLTKPEVQFEPAVVTGSVADPPFSTLPPRSG